MTKLFFALTLFLSLKSFAVAVDDPNKSSGGAGVIKSGFACEECEAMAKAKALLSNADGVFYPNGGTTTPGIAPTDPVDVTH